MCARFPPYRGRPSVDSNRARRRADNLASSHERRNKHIVSIVVVRCAIFETHNLWHFARRIQFEKGLFQLSLLTLVA